MTLEFRFLQFDYKRSKIHLHIHHIYYHHHLLFDDIFYNYRDNFSKSKFLYHFRPIYLNKYHDHIFFPNILEYLYLYKFCVLFHMGKNLLQNYNHLLYNLLYLVHLLKLGIHSMKRMHHHIYSNYEFCQILRQYNQCDCFQNMIYLYIYDNNGKRHYLFDYKNSIVLSI